MNQSSYFEQQIKSFFLSISSINFDEVFYDASTNKSIPFNEVFLPGKYSIVGNSSISLEKENGNNIDKSDYVIRFNNFQLENYEKHVGAKSNIWVTGGGIQAPNKIPENIQDGNITKILLLNNIKKFDYKKNKLLEKYGTLQSFVIFHNDLILSKIITLIQGIPTTGFVILLLLCAKYKKIDTYGFSFGSYKNKYHYYKDVVFQDYGHRWSKELEIFKLLVTKQLLKNYDINISSKPVNYPQNLRNLPKYVKRNLPNYKQVFRSKPFPESKQVIQHIGQPSQIKNFDKTTKDFNKITYDTQNKIIELNKLLNL